MGATTWLGLIGGFVLLLLGGDLLVRGASRLARRLGVSPLVIGLTVVAYGTGAPELVVSTTAVLDGRHDVAVGNVVGSNIFNVLFILGSCALLQPIIVSRQLVVREVPIMIGASLALLLFGLDGRLSVAEGLLMAAGVIVFTVDSIRTSRREGAALSAEFDASVPRPAGARTALADLAYVAVGVALLVLGGRALVTAAVALAHSFGLDEAIIALTIVAAGTGLPEVATSIVATLRGEREIAVGNVVGSNIFNVLGILGVASILAGGEGLAISPAIERFDIPVMTAVAFACLPIMARGHCLARWEGALFLAYYGAYTAYLVLAASQHAALPAFSAVMLEFVVPLTIATLLATGLANRRAASRDPSPRR